MPVESRKDKLKSLTGKAVMINQVYGKSIEDPNVDDAVLQGLVKELNKIKGYCQALIDDIAQ